MSGTRPAARSTATALALLVAGVAALDACGAPVRQEPAPSGREHYLSYGCGSCHGAEGHGDGPVAVSLDPKPRDFRDPDGYRQGRTLEDIADTLRIGVRAGDRISAMPSYSHLAEEERLAIATWIVSLQLASGSTESPRSPSGLRVEGGWVRALPASAPNSAAYLRLTNESSEPISIVGARSDAARSVEIHETTTRDGVSAMRRLERVVVAPGSSVELKPGAAHIMLIGLSEPLLEGSDVSLTLELSNGATLELSLPVRRE